MLLTLLVGLADHMTGWELSFSIFYLVPIAIAAWFGGRVLSLTAAVLSAIIWLVVDLAAGHGYSHALVPIWNGLVRLGFFLITAALIARQRGHLDLEAGLARTDSTTGLLNARAFREAGERMLDRARRSGRPFAMVSVDLDSFKSINDSLGHQAGDAVLAAVGRTLADTVRSTDLVARVGGDEFALVFEETGYSEAALVAEKVHDAIGRLVVEHGWGIGASVGAVAFTAAPGELDRALAAADAAMYRSKSSGKNRVELATWPPGRPISTEPERGEDERPSSRRLLQ